MKKFLCMLLTLAMLASMTTFAVSVSAAEVGKVEANYTPEGTAITDAAGFAAMTADGKYYLANDITIDATWNGGAALDATASQNNAFSGTFDGNGHTVTTTVPLFAILSGTVKNLTVAGSITSTAVGDGNGVNYGAAVAYYATGDIVVENVVNNVNISGVSVGAGLIAQVNTYSTGTLNVKNCVNNGNISTVNNNTTDATKGTNKYGGFVAYITGGTGTFENCVNNGVLSAVGGAQYGYFGGIVGQIGKVTSPLPTHETCNFTVKNCTNNANLSADALHCAGIVAFLYGHLEILDCTNNGNITNVKAAGSRAAGIFGATGGTDYKSSLLIDGCVNNGTVKGSYHAAGIAAYLGDGIAEDGANGWTYWLKNSANYGNIYLDGENLSTSYLRIGALAAYAAGGTYNGVENCVNMGDVQINLDYTTSNNPHTSALIGYVNNKNFTIKNNINAGNLIFDGIETTTVKPTASMIAYNNQASVTENTANNYSLPAIEGSILFRLKSGAALEDETKAKAVTAADIASGAVVYALNEAAGENIFYQDLKTGKITTVAAEDGSNLVIKDGDTYKNPEPVTGPQAIKNADDFAAMIPTGEYYLDADITLSASYEGIFTGILDGKNHTITTTAPLFNALAGTVKDLTVNANIADSGDAHNAIVAVQGSGDITFENVHTAGTVAGGNKVAALLAYGADGTNVTLNNCVNDATLTGADHVAGFVACVDGITNFYAENCVNNGDVTSTTKYGAGIVTIVGNDALTTAQAKDTTCTIKNCTNTGDIKGTTKNSAGIIGYAIGTTLIEGCVNRGNVENAEYASGIIGSTAAGAGKSAATVKNCENYGTLKGGKKVAGLSVYFGRSTAFADASYVVENFANYGDIYLAPTGSDGDGAQAAGVIGRTFVNVATQTPANVVKNCINAGNIYVDMSQKGEGTVKTSVAGIIAYTNLSNTVIENNINLGKIEVTNGEVDFAASAFIHRWYSKDKNPPSAINNNYSVSNEGIALALSDATDFTFTDAMVKEVSAAQAASGELVYTLNASAGETVFYQDLANNGLPTLKANDAHIVNKTGDVYHNGAAPAPEDTTTTPEDTTTTPEDTEPSTPPTGDSNASFIIIITVSVATLAIVSAFIAVKKKENE